MAHLVELTEAECRQLLAQEQVARVALCTPLGPRIMPVNYSLHDDEVFFRTMPYSVLGTYGREADMAMEVDRLDYRAHQGWSVVVLGSAAMVEDVEDLREIRGGWDPEPWTGGPRYFYIRLRMRDVTGRRLVADGRPSA